jgi:hypothetical protein
VIVHLRQGCTGASSLSPLPILTLSFKVLNNLQRSFGVATFTTIYPGWYSGRAVHIHFKVHPDETKVFTSQLFFDDALSQQVFAQAPYTSKASTPDTLNSTDSIYQDLLLLTTAQTAQGYAAAFDIGIDPTTVGTGESGGPGGSAGPLPGGGPRPPQP